MEFIATAEDFLSSYGFGSRGKMLGISRMLNESDLPLLSRGKVFISTRPRGLLSGFLTLIPSLHLAVFLPPLASRTQPCIIRMQVSDAVWNQGGAILSAYMTREKTLILEDVVMWKQIVVWQTQTFEERWNRIMKSFLENDCILDTTLQDFVKISLANYMPCSALKNYVHAPGSVMEFVCNAPNQKRLIWIEQDIETPARKDTTNHMIRREANIGPDIYSVWDTATKKRLGIALVRTLDVSKQLRMYKSDEFHACTKWNPTFEKWEIIEIV